MNKHLVTLMLLMLSAMLMANSGSIQLQRGKAQAEILSSDIYGMKVSFAIDQLNFQEIQSKEGVFTLLTANNFSSTNKVGEPRLPLLRKIISVPMGAEPQIRLSNTQRMKINLAERGINYPVIPSQESVSKSANPEDLPFVVNRNFYNGTRGTNNPSVKIEELGMLRGERLFALDYIPANYNPASKSLDIVSSTDVEITFNGADFSATSNLKAKTQSPAFRSALASTIWNYQDTRSSLMRYPIGYVIITPQSFIPALQPFVDWKTKEGYNVTVATIETIGNNVNSIKNYMQGIWNAATTENPAPSYLLIVGDVAQVASGASTIPGESHPTDLHYVRLQGTDYMPELYFGRFSATTPAEVTNQVNKTLMHEMYTMPDDSYLAEAVMIAGVDSYWSPTHANGAINYATTRYFNTAHGIDSHTYLYPASGNSQSQIIADVSAGAGYVNYTAHGDVTYWHDPRFNISNINSLQNQNKYSYVVGNCCLTSKFDANLSFAEAWLRAENKGAVIYIGGTNSTYWDEDYWWAVGAKGSATGQAAAYDATKLGVYDALFHENGEVFADWASTAGANILMGNLAVVQGNSSLINYYWEIYSIMGDPSLVPYIGIPAANSMQVPETLFMGLDSMEINADPYTWVSISMNGINHGVGLTDASGYLNLEFTPFDQPGNADIVATRSRLKPLISTISVIPNEGPYVTVGNILVADESGTAEAGETVPIDLDFNNVGILDATNLTVSISTSSPWVYIPDNEVTISDISANGVLNVPAIFSLNIDQGTPDQHVAEFAIDVSDGEHLWTSNRSLTINAPNVVISSVSYFDPNNDGIYDAGETIDITLNITNIGHMTAESGTLNLILNSDSATLSIANFTVPGMATGGVIPLNFELMIAPDADLGTTIAVGIALDMGMQMINHGLIIPVGAIMEGFETGDFSSFVWQNVSTQPWVIVNNDRNSGVYSAKSGSITHNQSTNLELTMDVMADGEVSFFRKVSSESGWDYLKFYIDGTEQGSWSGNQAWAEVSFPVSAGSRTFKWTYIKDGSMSSGTDCAWIDDIRFPLTGSSELPMAYTNTESVVFDNVFPNSTNNETFVLRNLGTADLSGTITIPVEFELQYMGQTLPNDYYYVVSPGVTRSFTVVYVAGVEVPAINGNIQIMTNDPDMPSIAIPISVNPSSNENLVNPAVTELKGNFPNPFNPQTTIRFSLKDAGHVKLNIYNMKGQLVKSLVNAPLSSGNHQMVWNGRDDKGNPVSSGIYLYRMSSGTYQATQKMMLMK